MEWLMSIEDTKYWVKRVLERSKSLITLSEKVLKDLKQYLTENNLYIGPAIFTSGFLIVLLKACQSVYVDIVQYVLEHHSEQFDINQLISCNYLVPEEIEVSSSLIFKQTLVHAAVESNYLRQSQSRKLFMLPRTHEESENIVTVQILSLILLKLLVYHGASINIPDSFSVTPLLEAVSTHNPSKEIVNYLLKVGADVHYRDMKGQTVLMYAVMCRTDKDIISLLLKAGADPTLTDECGYTVLHHAILSKNLHAIKVLFSFDILPNLCSLTSKIPAFFLADRKNFLVRNLYCDKAPNPNIITDFVTNHPLCPPQLKVDSILLNASYLFFKNPTYQTPNYQICHDRFKEGLTLRAQLKLPPPTLSEPIEAYGGLTEITSIEEFKENYSDLTNITTQVNLAYQCLIIRERCLGYGDSTVIQCLFAIGKWMISTQNHYTQGLLLWVRATEVLMSRLQTCTKSDHNELSILITSGYMSCFTSITTSSETQNLFGDINICQIRFLPVLRNLIMCQQLSVQLCTTIEAHVHSLYHYDHKNSFMLLLMLLKYLYKNTNLHNDVSILCREAIDRCPTFPTSSPLHSNLLDLLLTSFDVTTDFLSLLLESGGHIFVNEVGCDGFRPLKLSKSKEITSLLLAHGAHPDAVSRPISEDEQFINPHLDDYFSTPLPLACLSARSIVSESIPYQSIDLPSHIKGFIALHDPADIAWFDNVVT